MHDRPYNPNHRGNYGCIWGTNQCGAFLIGDFNPRTLYDHPAWYGYKCLCECKSKFEAKFYSLSFIYRYIFF